MEYLQISWLLRGRVLFSSLQPAHRYLVGLCVHLESNLHSEWLIDRSLASFLLLPINALNGSQAGALLSSWLSLIHPLNAHRKGLLSFYLGSPWTTLQMAHWQSLSFLPYSPHPCSEWLTGGGFASFLAFPPLHSKWLTGRGFACILVLLIHTPNGSQTGSFLPSWLPNPYSKWLTGRSFAFFLAFSNLHSKWLRGRAKWLKFNFLLGWVLLVHSILIPHFLLYAAPQFSYELCH